MFPSVLAVTAAPKEKGKDVYYARLEKASEKVSDAEVRRTINDYTCSPSGDSGQMEADDGSNYRKVQRCMYGATALVALVSVAPNPPASLTSTTSPSTPSSLITMMLPPSSFSILIMPPWDIGLFTVTPASTGWDTCHHCLGRIEVGVG